MARAGWRLPLIFAWLVAFVLGAANLPVQAAARFAVASNDWNNTATWSTVCGGAPGSSFPVAADTATICTGFTVTVTADASVTTVTLNAPAANNGIIINSGVTLDASGAVTMNIPSAGSVDQTINVGAGTLKAASLAIPGSATAGRDCLVTVSTGTITVSGAITFSGTAAQAKLTSTGASTINIGGNFGAGGTLTTSGTDKINFNGSAVQTVGNYTTYSNIDVNSSGSIVRIAAGTTTLSGALKVFSGTVNIRGVSVTVNSVTTVASGATLNFNTSNAGNKIFVGLVTIDGSWVNTAVNETPFFRGGLIFNGTTFNSGTGAYTFQTNSQQIGGSSAITFNGTVAISSAITVTNTNTDAAGITVTAATGITGIAGTNWTQDPSTTLVVTGPLLTTAGTVLNASAVSNTVVYAGATAHAIKVPSSNTYYHLTTSGTSTKTMPASALTINGDFTHNGTSATASTAGGAMTVAGNFSLGASARFTTGAFTHSVGGDWTNNGIFTASASSTVTFNGAAAQTLDGTAFSTFSTLNIANVAGAGVNSVTIVKSPTVSAALSFTSGILVTGANVVTVTTAGTTSGAGSATYVFGCVRKNFPADAVSPFQTFTFPIGDSKGHTPATVTFTTASTVGDLTACTTGTDHPQVTTAIATTGIDKNASVNRYWTLTPNLNLAGTPTGTYSVTFAFVTADRGELSDAQLTDPTATVIVERYDGAVWYPTTIGTRNTLNTTATGIIAIATGSTSYGDFAIGVPLSGITPTPPGALNAFEAATPANAIIGKLNTRVAGLSSGNFAIVGVSGGRIATVTTTVKGWIIDSSDSSGTVDANGCRTSWKFRGTATAVSPMPGSPPATDFTVGIAGARVNTATFVAPSSVAYPDARLLLQDSGAGTLIGCSTDRLAIRPAILKLEGRDTDYQSSGTGRLLNNTSATGGNVHMAATAGSPKPFTIQVTFQDNAASTTANASGVFTPAEKSKSCGTLCTTLGGLTYGSWAAFSGGVGTITANYSEAGTFFLQMEDTSFASVDTNDGTPVTGNSSFPFGYTIPQAPFAGPADVEIGRFVPAYFDLATANTPQFQTFGAGCANPRTFTYAGQPFGFVTAPKATVTAKNAAGATVTNYRGTLWKVTTGAPSDVTLQYNPMASLDVLPGTPTVTDNSNGTGTIDVGADAVAYKRISPLAPFAANITLTVSVRDDSESGVTDNPSQITTTTPAVFDSTPTAGSGIAFDGGTFAVSPTTIVSGTAIVFGRLRLQNATGSELIDLKVPMTAESYTGTGFTTNTDDSCTGFTGGAGGNFTFINYRAPLSAANLPTSNIVYTGTTLSLGVGSLKITKPSPAAIGSVTICADLDTGVGTDSSCVATTPAGKSWLQGPWGSLSYDKDPKARAAFGTYGAQPNNVIFFRENY